MQTRYVHCALLLRSLAPKQWLQVKLQPKVESKQGRQVCYAVLKNRL